MTLIRQHGCTVWSAPFAPKPQRQVSRGRGPITCTPAFDYKLIDETSKNVLHVHFLIVDHNNHTTTFLVDKKDILVDIISLCQALRARQQNVCKHITYSTITIGRASICY